tara:strand:+ start:262 stop:582 length:321 start_codon:yes stop_codon:yes gene_type:complete
MKLTQEMIDEIQELMNHTKKNGDLNWVDGEELQINLAGTFAADRFIVIQNVSKKPWEPSINSSKHPDYDPTFAEEFYKKWPRLLESPYRKSPTERLHDDIRRANHD